MPIKSAAGDALGYFNNAQAIAEKGVKSLKDVGDIHQNLALAFTGICFAFFHLSDKLDQIDKKLSSTAHRRPTM
jgi:hypothetical protein